MPKVSGGRQSTSGYFDRPLAPASRRVLFGVCVAAFLLLAAASSVPNDWCAVFACFGVLALAAVVLDISGRRRAEREPHDLYATRRLPTEQTLLKPTLICGTLIVLLTWVILTARPGVNGTPFPYFLSAGFLYLVMPQWLARRIVARHDRLLAATLSSASGPTTTVAVPKSKPSNNRNNSSKKRKKRR